MALGFVESVNTFATSPYPVVSGFMTAIGIIILATQIAPSLGYYPKEDSSYVTTFIPQAEALLLENLLEKESEEGILVLEDFKTTIDRAQGITPEDIQQEAATLASREASGVMGTFKVLPQIFSNINATELILALLTIFIIYGLTHYKSSSKHIGSIICGFSWRLFSKN